MRTAIVDYGMGNLGSLTALLTRLEVSWTIWSGGEPPSDLDFVIFPGVGSMRPALDHLTQRGLAEPLDRLFRHDVPILGICLGLQLFFESSEEGGRGLGWIEGKVVPLAAERTPHMGWNTLMVDRPHPLFDQVGEEDAFYFVHSYRVAPADPRWVYARTDYDEAFPSVIIRPPLVGVQFHPELSSRTGRRLLQNYMEWVKG